MCNYCLIAIVYLLCSAERPKGMTSFGALRNHANRVSAEACCVPIYGAEKTGGAADGAADAGHDGRHVGTGVDTEGNTKLNIGHWPKDGKWLSYCRIDQR